MRLHCRRELLYRHGATRFCGNFVWTLLRPDPSSIQPLEQFEKNLSKHAYILMIGSLWLSIAATRHGQIQVSCNRGI